MVKPPCMGCTERVLRCHSNCPKYADYRDKLYRQNVQIKANLALSEPIIPDGFLEARDKYLLKKARGRL